MSSAATGDEDKVQAAIAAWHAVPDARKAEVVARTSGLQDDLTPRAKSWIWGGIFAMLGLALAGALLLILRSYNVDLTTTTGSGMTRVTAVTHPDVSAAWALASSVVAGVVGLLAPSPRSGPK